MKKFMSHTHMSIYCLFFPFRPPPYRKPRNSVGLIWWGAIGLTGGGCPPPFPAHVTVPVPKTITISMKFSVLRCSIYLPYT